VIAFVRGGVLKSRTRTSARPTADRKATRFIS
jgi:hypothetical protein